MRRRSAALGLALGALAGCAPAGLPLEPTVLVPAPAGAVAQGQAEVLVRAFVAAPGGDRREVGGAACALSSILFTTTLRTPARVRVPSYGPQSPTLVAACRAGELSGAAEQRIVTRWVRAPGAWPGPGPWGPPYGGPWGWGGWSGWGWDAPSFPVFVYPPLEVSLS
jgi:hypothetical protein